MVLGSRQGVDGLIENDWESVVGILVGGQYYHHNKNSLTMEPAEVTYATVCEPFGRDQQCDVLVHGFHV